MANIRQKIINNKPYLYAEYSFRLPDNSIKKISKFIANKLDANSDTIKEYFKQQEERSLSNYALQAYKQDHILTAKTLQELELIKLNYKRLMQKVSIAQQKDIRDRFTINFTYETNALEGNSLTLKDVTLILQENIISKNQNLREVYETRNTRKAHDLLFSKNIKITQENIIKLHATLVQDTGIATGFKKLPNFLVMRNVKTTFPENVEKEISDLIEWYNYNKNKEHPLKVATHFHAVFEKIHPFEDGNGITGRILLNAILLNAGFPPIIIRKTMRVSYFSALEAYDKGYKDKLTRFNLEKLKETYKKFFLVYVQYLK